MAIRTATRNNKGFTLIELLLYVSLLSILLFVIFNFLGLVLQGRVRNQVIAEVEQQGNQIIQIITQSIKNADLVNFPLQSTTSTSLSLQVYNSSLNPTIFDLTSGQIRITEGTNTPIPLHNNQVVASNLFFYNLSRNSSPDLIYISFDLTYNSTSSRSEYTYSKTFYSSAEIGKLNLPR